MQSPEQPAAADSTARTRVEIHRDSTKTRVEVDGVDITESLTGVQVTQYAGDLPLVVVSVRPRPDEEPLAVLKGLARVMVDDGSSPELDPGPAAAKFLSAMDPETLEKAALHDLRLEPGPYGVTKMMLTLLTEWASGKGEQP